METFSKGIMLLILTSAILFSSVSCADKNESGTIDSETRTSEISSDTEAETPELPTIDYGGYEFKIIMRSDNLLLPTMQATEQNGDIVNDAVYSRNAAVSEKYNVKFIISSDESDYYGEKAKTAILSGDDAYDLIITHGRNMLTGYVGENLLLDWNSDLPYINLDNKC